ncbi:MAG TPA: hypothetical protein VG268_21740 [Streptosporangiaceae bacterium]|jgi:hypothetical protein|nr:hypothetical protein [Streptosporangiaceae bacterium]
MTNLHAELVVQPGSRADSARLACGWMSEGRRRLFPDFDRILETAGPGTVRGGDPPDDDDAPWGPPGGLWAQVVVRQQPQAIGGTTTPYSARNWRRALDGLERSQPYLVRLDMMPLDQAGRPVSAGPPATLTVQRSQHDPRWARFEAEAPDRLVPWAGTPDVPLDWAGFVKEQAGAVGAHYGHVTDDATSHGTALERALLGVLVEPPGIPRCRDVLRGYSWVTIAAARLAARLGGAGALTASGCLDEVSVLPGGQVFLRATPVLAEYEGAAVRRVFGVLAPVLPAGRPDPEAVSGSRVRLVLDANAADGAGAANGADGAGGGVDP